jgi:hypothetical protein
MDFGNQSIALQEQINVLADAVQAGLLKEINALAPVACISFYIPASSLNTGPEGKKLEAWLNEETVLDEGVELGNVVLALRLGVCVIRYRMLQPERPASFSSRDSSTHSQF